MSAKSSPAFNHWTIKPQFFHASNSISYLWYIDIYGRIRSSTIRLHLSSSTRVLLDDAIDAIAVWITPAQMHKCKASRVTPVWWWKEKREKRIVEFRTRVHQKCTGQVDDRPTYPLHHGSFVSKGILHTRSKLFLFCSFLGELWVGVLKSGFKPCVSTSKKTALKHLKSKVNVNVFEKNLNSENLVEVKEKTILVRLRGIF